MNANTIAQDAERLPADRAQEPAKRRRSLTRVGRLAAEQLVAPVATGVFLVLLLELLSRSGFVSELILPSPFKVLEAMVEQLTSSLMWEHMRITVQEGVLGFLIGSAIGIVCGVGIGISRWISKGIYPYVVLIQSMPRVALAPVFVAIFGFGMGAKVWTAVAICFFPVLINTISGLRSYDADELAMLRSMCASKTQIFFKLLWPTALPQVFSGLKTNLTLAMLGAIVGELTAANAGIGMLIETAAFQLRMPDVFAYIMWLAVVSLVLFAALDVVESKIVYWKEEARKGIFTKES